MSKEIKACRFYIGTQPQGCRGFKSHQEYNYVLSSKSITIVYRAGVCSDNEKVWIQWEEPNAKELIQLELRLKNLNHTSLIKKNLKKLFVVLVNRIVKYQTGFGLSGFYNVFFFLQIT